MKAIGRRELLTRVFTPRRPPVLVAHIQKFDCLARGGQVCTVCIERCPVPGAVVVDGTRVRIMDTACTGCGVCRDVCPAPTPAIVLWPRPADELPGSTRR